MTTSASTPLGFRFAREARVRSGAVDDEDAPDQRAPELLTDAVGLLELVMRRYERASTILTSNRPVEDWGKLLGDNAAVSAMLDRLLHHAHVLKCGPRSYRTHRAGLSADAGHE